MTIPTKLSAWFWSTPPKKSSRATRTFRTPSKFNSPRSNQKKTESQFGITRFRLKNDPVLAAALSPPAYVVETSDESLSMLGIRAEMRGLGGPGALGDLPLAVISHGEPIDETPGRDAARAI
jgi:hypothetical protein